MSGQAPFAGRGNGSGRGRDKGTRNKMPHYLSRLRVHEKEFIVIQRVLEKRLEFFEKGNIFALAMLCLGEIDPQMRAMLRQVGFTEQNVAMVLNNCPSFQAADHHDLQMIHAFNAKPKRNRLR